jgi:hypothetical protein
MVESYSRNNSVILRFSFGALQKSTMAARTAFADVRAGPAARHALSVLGLTPSFVAQEGQLAASRAGGYVRVTLADVRRLNAAGTNTQRQTGLFPSLSFSFVSVGVLT